MRQHVFDDHLLARDWRWQDFGSGMMLVTQTGGAKVVLSAEKGPLFTRDAEGYLCPILATSPVGMAVAASPQLLRALDKAYEFCLGFEDDELQEGMGELLAEIRAALKAGGRPTDDPSDVQAGALLKIGTRVTASCPFHNIVDAPGTVSDYVDKSLYPTGHGDYLISFDHIKGSCIGCDAKDVEAVQA